MYQELPAAARAKISRPGGGLEKWNHRSTGKRPDTPISALSRVNPLFYPFRPDYFSNQPRIVSSSGLPT